MIEKAEEEKKERENPKVKKSLSALIEDLDLEEGDGEELEERSPQEIQNAIGVSKDINLIKQASE